MIRGPDGPDPEPSSGPEHHVPSQAPSAHIECDAEEFLGRLRSILAREPHTVVLARNADDILLYSPAATAGHDCRVRGHGPTELLTERELQILIYLAEGFPVTAIAHRCGISVNTCRAHVRSVLIKLGAHSQLAAVLAAAKAGILPQLWSG